MFICFLLRKEDIVIKVSDTFWAEFSKTIQIMTKFQVFLAALLEFPIFCFERHGKFVRVSRLLILS